MTNPEKREQISASLMGSLINDINVLKEKEHSRLSFSAMTEILLMEAVAARKKKNKKQSA